MWEDGLAASHTKLVIIFKGQELLPRCACP
jgi:hypothetical protein